VKHLIFALTFAVITANAAAGAAQNTRACIKCGENLPAKTVWDAEDNWIGGPDSHSFREVLMELGREHNFSYQIAEGSNPKVLGCMFKGDYPTQPLGRIIEKMLGMVGASADFKGRIAVITSPATLPSGFCAPAQPAAPPAPPTPAPVTEPQATPQRDGEVAQLRREVAELRAEARAARDQQETSDDYADETFATRRLPPPLSQPRMAQPEAYALTTGNDGYVKRDYRNYKYAGLDPWGNKQYIYTGADLEAHDPITGASPYFYGANRGPYRRSMRNGPYGGHPSAWNWGHDHDGRRSLKYARELRNFRNEPRLAAFKLHGPDGFLCGVMIYVNGEFKNVGCKTNNKWDAKVPVSPHTRATVTLTATFDGQVACHSLSITPESMAQHMAVNRGDEWYFEIPVNRDMFVVKRDGKEVPKALFNEATKTCGPVPAAGS
jgi:hypothetical protein